MVPEGWKRKPIGDVCAAIVDCVNKTAPVVDEPTLYKMIRTTNVRHGRVDTNNVRYVSEETFRTWTRRGELQDEDIILTREAPVGEVGQLRNAQGMFLGQRTMVYRANIELMDQQFLYQSMIGPSLIRQYHAGSAGGTVAHIRVPDCSKFVLSVPPLPEQRKIADILSTWDEAIEKTEALLSNARTQKRALMQQLLTGKRRFPAFEGQPWKEVRLGDVSDIDANSLGSKTPANFEFDYIALSNVEPGQIVGPLETHIYAEAPSRARRKVSDGDLLVSTVRPNLMGFVRVTEAYAQCIASTGFAVVSPKASVSASYLFHYLFSHHMESQIHALVVGSNYPAINSSDVKKLKIKMPQFGEQVRIGEILDECDLESSRLNTNLTKLRTEKKALMQQLLTGKRRVVV